MQDMSRHHQALCLGDGGYFICLVTDHAVAVHGVAVKLYHLFVARRLMQTVDILGDHSTQLSLLFPFSQFQVSGIGLNVKAQYPLALEFKKRVGVVFQQSGTEIGSGREIILFCV